MRVPVTDDAGRGGALGPFCLLNRLPTALPSASGAPLIAVPTLFSSGMPPVTGVAVPFTFNETSASECVSGDAELATTFTSAGVAPGMFELEPTIAWETWALYVAWRLRVVTESSI